MKFICEIAGMFKRCDKRQMIITFYSNVAAAVRFSLVNLHTGKNVLRPELHHHDQLLNLSTKRMLISLPWPPNQGARSTFCLKAFRSHAFAFRAALSMMTAT